VKVQKTKYGKVVVIIKLIAGAFIIYLIGMILLMAVLKVIKRNNETYDKAMDEYIEEMNKK
jgi:biotin transporter BioY